MTERILEDILKQISVDSIFNDDFINKFTSDFEYQGFNATKILKLVHDHILANDTNGKSKGSENILKLVALGLFRGNKVSAMVKTLKSSEANWLKAMIKEFNIVDRINDKTLSSKSNEANVDKVTLSRFRMALPQYAMKALLFNKLVRQVTIDNLRENFRDLNTFPLCLRDMCIMSLIPKKTNSILTSDIFDVIIAYIFAYSFTETGILIDTSSNRKSDDQRAKDVVKYMKISHNATHVTATMRNETIRIIVDSLAYNANRKAMEEDKAIILNQAIQYGIDLSEIFNIEL